MYGKDTTSAGKKGHKIRSRLASGVRIIGHGIGAQAAIGSIGFAEVSSGIHARGRFETISIRDSFFYKVLGSCIDGEIDGDLAIEHSLIDGCALTVDSYSREGNDREKVLKLQSNVVRIGIDEAEAAAAFRFDENHMLAVKGNWSIEAYDNIFLVESHSATMLLQEMLVGSLNDCSDNVVVWRGDGEFAGELPECFSVTTSVDVWEEARIAWIRNHQMEWELEEVLVGTNERSELPYQAEVESHVESEAEANAQKSLRRGLRGHTTLAGRGASRPRSLAVSRRTRLDEIGSSWSDGTLWSDGTGWADFSRGSLVSCRESQGFRPMTGSTVCSP